MSPNNSQRLESARKISEIVESSWPRCRIHGEPIPKWQRASTKPRIWSPGKVIETDLRSEAGWSARNRGGWFPQRAAKSGPDRASCEQALNQLAPEYQSAAKSALDAWDAQWQAFRNSEIENVLNQAEERPLANLARPMASIWSAPPFRKSRLD
jgi:hypothetical protein